MKTKLQFLPALFVFFLLCIGTGKAQKEGRPITTIASSFTEIPALRDIPIVPPVMEGRIIKQNWKRKKHTNKNALPLDKKDPLRQTKHGFIQDRDIGVNFDGMTQSNGGGYTPPDVNGAIGPGHYVELINVAMAIYDRSGNLLYGPTMLSNVFPGSSNDGDPIVLYDHLADRWLISEFQMSGNEELIAISKTGDPLGEWYQYSFTQPSFPDYPKLGLWSDGYYMSVNSGSSAVVFERTEMIAGNPLARQVILSLPSYNTSGFRGAGAVNLTGPGPPAGTPGYILYFEDDGWSGVSADAYKVWEFSVDWNNTGNSAVTLAYTLNATPFNSEFTSSWDDISQPGTSQKLDALANIVMFPSHYRNFGSYSSMVSTFVVDVDGNNLAGIRWFELRDNHDGNGWSVYQEGTYAPSDNINRWNASICIDQQGNLGMGFNICDATSTYPSLRYTGRLSSDPLGTMTVAEGVVVDGTSSQSGTNRWGDYSATTMDPTDNLTFWHAGEYMKSGSWGTRIFSFKIAPNLPIDLGVTEITAPVTGVLSSTEQVTVTVRNFGSQAQSSFNVSYTIDGGSAVTEAVSQNLDPNATMSYTFTQTADLSAVGTYEFKSYTTITGDGMAENDTTTTLIKHNSPFDVGVTSFIAPVSGIDLTNTESVTVTIKNFGTSDAANFPVSYTINGGAPVMETVAQTITPTNSISYTFAQTADLSVYDTYDFVGYTAMTNDGDLLNDTANTAVDNLEPNACTPTSDCSEGDGFQRFVLNTIDNVSTCSPNGYGDYTNLSTELTQGQTYTVEVESGYDEQVLSLWIDLNNNLLFEDSERLIEDYAAGANLNFSTTLTIPIDANLGPHRLRVRTNWQNSSNDPCIDYQYGETEDYTVDVRLFVGMEDIYGEQLQFNVLNNLTDRQVKVQISGVDADFNLSVVNVLGQIIYTEPIDVRNSGISRTIDFSNFRKGLYFVRICNSNTVRTEKVIYE